METRYCPSCGQDVPVEHMLEGNYLLSCCENCGLGLGVKLASADVVRRFQAGRSLDEGSSLGRVGLAQREMSIAPAVERPSPPDPRSASGPAASSGTLSSGDRSLGGRSRETPAPASSSGGASMEVSGERVPGGAVSRMRQVAIVEDSEFLRKVTRDLLDERQLAREVVDYPDGMAFLESFTRAAAGGQKPDLVVLDVRMPGIDGREAAYAMRAIESGLGIKKRTPILFFSGVLCDAEFKAQLREIRNARYIRKAEGGEAQELGQRIVSVLERLVGGR